MQAEIDLLAHLCDDFQADSINREQFQEAVWAIVSPFDGLTITMLLSQVEATVRQHTCWWWRDCEKDCFYLREKSMVVPWKDGWSTLEYRRSPKPDYDHASPIAPITAREKVTGKVRLQVFARDGHRCKKCEGLPPLEVDHIMPVSRGGSSDLENLQALCVPCNRKKRNNVP